jgi:rRNA maturation protein Nop10
MQGRGIENKIIIDMHQHWGSSKTCTKCGNASTSALPVRFSGRAQRLRKCRRMSDSFTGSRRKERNSGACKLSMMHSQYIRNHLFCHSDQREESCFTGSWKILPVGRDDILGFLRKHQ